MENDSKSTETIPIPPQPAAPGLVQPNGDKPIGGWLILLAIGFILSPLLIGYNVYANILPAFKPETIQLMTAPGTEYYNPMLFNVIIFELVFDVILFAAFIFLLVLFFKKSKHFPLAFIIIYIFNFAGITLDTFWAHYAQNLVPVYKADMDLKDVVQQAVYCCIWVPYIIVSKRVKETFVK